MSSDDSGQWKVVWIEKSLTQKKYPNLKGVKQSYHQQESQVISVLILHYHIFLNTNEHNCIYGERGTKNEKDCDGEGHV